MSKRKRYIVHPGWVYSANDGERHWVGFLDLVRLHNVRVEECLNAEHGLFSIQEQRTLQHLYPSKDGVYGKKA